jgi:hypothetical protein
MVRPADVSNAAILKFTEADILMGDNFVAAEGHKVVSLDALRLLLNVETPALAS